MKVWIIAGMLTLALATPVLAHCGKCGVGGEHAKEGAAASEVHAGAQCPMHAEKNAVLLDAAKALETSNPELSVKLKDMAQRCCGG